MKATVNLLVVTLLLPLGSEVLAQDDAGEVRRQLLYRSNRFELAPALAHTLNDPYRRSALFQVSGNYHLTNSFSLGLTIGGGLNYNTNIADNIEEANPDVADSLDYSDRTVIGNFNVGYVPFYGKFNILEATTVNYDFHLNAGIGGALISNDNPDAEGFKFGPMIGAGFRFFFNGDMALAIDLVDYMYSTADVARSGLPVEEEFSHNVLVSIGVSFFVTGELRVSR